MLEDAILFSRINGNYGTEIGARRQKKFGRILLDQIFTLIEYTNSTWDNETIIVTCQPRNESMFKIIKLSSFKQNSVFQDIFK